MVGANPNPAHITSEFWWFVGQIDLLSGSDSIHAGTWGVKPGYHCDAYNLWWHKDSAGHYDWRDDYSLQYADDKVVGTALEQYGAATDLTFASAQAGNFATIRLYSDRIRAAWKARDPRLKGWREVLCNASDGDSGADGYDFVSWTERTPDSTHKWHMHFSVLRKYLRQRVIFEAMLSILRGESLAQWNARGSEEMPNTFHLSTALHGKEQDGYWVSFGTLRRRINDNDDMGKLQLAYAGRLVPLPSADHNGWPVGDLPWSVDEVDRLLGAEEIPADVGDTGSSGGDGSLVAHTHSGGQTGPAVPS